MIHHPAPSIQFHWNPFIALRGGNALVGGGGGGGDGREEGCLGTGGGGGLEPAA